MLFPYLRQVLLLTGGNCRLKMPVVKGRGAQDLLHEMTNPWVFQSGKNILCNTGDNLAVGVGSSID